VACGHLLRDVAVEQGIEGDILCPRVLCVFVQLKELGFDLLPDGLLCPVESAVEVLATEETLAVLLNVVPELRTGTPRRSRWRVLHDE
jgi:hypothetical protein